MRFHKHLFSPRTAARACRLAAALVLVLGVLYTIIAVNAYFAYLKSLEQNQTGSTITIYNNISLISASLSPAISTLVTTIFFSAILFTVAAVVDRFLVTNASTTRPSTQTASTARTGQAEASYAPLEPLAIAPLGNGKVDDDDFNDTEFQIVPLPGEPGKK